MDLGKLFFLWCPKSTRKTMLTLDLMIELVFSRIRNQPAKRFSSDIAEIDYRGLLLIP